ncbi:hypothetical protein HanIR_Chr14g0700341 [Helianthus annuus]|nr:hypothetical protein HanIR_Chr14g0700341 [Helianthus annuus]
MAGSPQSMLCGCKNGSSRGSPTCRSPTEANRNETSWDLLYAAAGEVARMRMVEEAASHNASQRLRKIGSYDLHYQQLKVAKFEKLKQQQIAKQQYLQMMLQNKTRNVTNCQPAAPSVWAWLASQQAQPQRLPGSGMRDVSTKRESTGTGVTPQPMAESSGYGTERNRLSRSLHNNYYYYSIYIICPIPYLK